MYWRYAKEISSRQGANAMYGLEAFVVNIFSAEERGLTPYAYAKRHLLSDTKAFVAANASNKFLRPFLNECGDDLSDEHSLCTIYNGANKKDKQIFEGLQLLTDVCGRFSDKGNFGLTVLKNAVARAEVRSLQFTHLCMLSGQSMESSDIHRHRWRQVTMALASAEQEDWSLRTLGGVMTIAAIMSGFREAELIDWLIDVYVGNYIDKRELPKDWQKESVDKKIEFCRSCRDVFPAYADILIMLGKFAAPTPLELSTLDDDVRFEDQTLAWATERYGGGVVVNVYCRLLGLHKDTYRKHGDLLKELRWARGLSKQKDSGGESGSDEEECLSDEEAPGEDDC